MGDCFNGPDSVYDEADFERRFRMPKSVFNRMEAALMGTDPFTQKRDIVGRLGMHPLVKLLVVCFRCVACGDAHDREDENPRIAQGTLNPIVRDFASLTMQHFGPTHLNRSPSHSRRATINVTSDGW